MRNHFDVFASAYFSKPPRSRNQSPLRAAQGAAVNEHLPLSDWIALSVTEKVAFFTENEIELCETVEAQLGEEFWEVNDHLVVAFPLPSDCTEYVPLLNA